MRTSMKLRFLALLTGASLLTTGMPSAISAFATAGEDPGTVSDSEKTFPDPDSLTPNDVNFAKALQLSLYFYDANKCGETSGRLEWRDDCHLEDAKVPLIPMTDRQEGTNLSQEFIDKYRSILDPDGDGTVDVSGGLHDAGDHVKFGLPGTYAASTLGWGYYEFRDAYKDAGQQEHIEDILHWFNEFYLKCLYYDKNGDVLAFCYQVGEGNNDHNYWVCPELQGTWLLNFNRPAYFATVETPASDMCAGAAASLAVNYLNFKDTEPEFAAESLKAAKALYRFAVQTHSERQIINTGDDKPIEEQEGYDPDNPDAINAGAENSTMEVTSLGFDGGFYTSSYDYDELSWAAVWLYYCTEDWDYIDDIISVDETVTNESGGHPYTGYLRRIIKDSGTCWQNIWVHCWDTVWGGVFAKLAPVTNIRRDWYIFRWNLEFWSGMTPNDAAANTGIAPAVTSHKYFGLDDELYNTSITAEEIADLPEAQGAFLKKTPAGFGMLNEYGSARYDTAAQLCALVYAKETGDDVFVNWCSDQMSYIMGNNPMGRAYIVGYDLENGASHPHHRAAHGSTTQSMDDPEDQMHVLWGALVGGPDASDWHRDITKDYVYNEVAVDYNAGFVGACAGLYKYIGKEAGHQPEANFPPSELELNGGVPITEFTLKASVGQEDSRSTQVLIEIDNHTSLPPRYLDGVEVRYYFNISEMMEEGLTVDDLIVRPDYDSLKSNTDGEYAVTWEVVQYNENGDCYVAFYWPKSRFYGTEQFQFALVNDHQNAEYQDVWEPENDYSRSQLVTAKELGVDLNVSPQFTDGLTMYIDGVQVWGTAPEELQNSLGDINVDGKVNLTDAVLLQKWLLAVPNTLLTDWKSGDINDDGKLDVRDLSLLKQMLLGK